MKAEECEAHLEMNDDGICMIRAIADVCKVHLGTTTQAKVVSMVRDGGLLWSECLQIIREAPEFTACFPPNYGESLLQEENDSLRLPYGGKTIVLRKTRHGLYHAMICDVDREREAVNPTRRETFDNGVLEHDLYLPRCDRPLTPAQEWHTRIDISYCITQYVSMPQDTRIGGYGDDREKKK